MPEAIVYPEFSLADPERTPSPQNLKDLYLFDPIYLAPFEELWGLYTLADPSFAAPAADYRDRDRQLMDSVLGLINMLTPRDQRLFAADIAETVLPVFEEAIRRIEMGLPSARLDHQISRVRHAIQVARDVAYGLVTDEVRLATANAISEIEVSGYDARNAKDAVRYALISDNPRNAALNAMSRASHVAVRGRVVDHTTFHRLLRPYFDAYLTQREGDTVGRMRLPKGRASKRGRSIVGGVPPFFLGDPAHEPTPRQLLAIKRLGATASYLFKELWDLYCLEDPALANQEMGDGELIEMLPEILSYKVMYRVVFLLLNPMVCTVRDGYDGAYTLEAAIQEMWLFAEGKRTKEDLAKHIARVSIFREKAESQTHRFGESRDNALLAFLLSDAVLAALVYDMERMFFRIRAFNRLVYTTSHTNTSDIDRDTKERILHEAKSEFRQSLTKYWDNTAKIGAQRPAKNRRRMGKDRVGGVAPFSLHSPAHEPTPEQLVYLRQLSPSVASAFDGLWQLYTLEDPNLLKSDPTPAYERYSYNEQDRSVYFQRFIRSGVEFLSREAQTLFLADLVEMVVPTLSLNSPKSKLPSRVVQALREYARNPKKVGPISKLEKQSEALLEKWLSYSRECGEYVGPYYAAEVVSTGIKAATYLRPENACEFALGDLWKLLAAFREFRDPQLQSDLLKIRAILADYLIGAR